MLTRENDLEYLTPDSLCLSLGGGKQRRFSEKPNCCFISFRRKPVFSLPFFRFKIQYNYNFVFPIRIYLLFIFLQFVYYPSYRVQPPRLELPLGFPFPDKESYLNIFRVDQTFHQLSNTLVNLVRLSLCPWSILILIKEIFAKLRYIHQ